MPNFATVFDGLLPASLNPGIDPGVSVLGWTPTESGIYQLMLQAPDEPGAPFMFADNVVVDMGAVIPGIQFSPSFSGSLSEFQPGVDVGASMYLVTLLGHDVRAVMKVALVAATVGSGSDDSMIISLEEIKVALGIEPGDTTEDASLILLESYAAAYVENQTERRWRAPAEKKEYQFGTGTRTLFLEGHVEPADVAAIAVRENLGGGQWNVLAAFDYRAPNKLIRNDSYVWHPGVEYEITYQDGWLVAPPDIRALVLDLMTLSRDAASAEAGIKSETIGDYSYTLDSVAAAALTSLSGASVDTLNRRRAKHI